MQEIIKYLESSFELTRYEAKLYVAAYRLEKANVSELAQSAGLPRTAVYAPLKKLVRQGLISPLKEHGKHTRYFATDPKYLESLFARKQLDLGEAIRLLGNMRQGGKDISFRYFEGRDGIEAASEIFLKESKVKLWKTFENPKHMKDLARSFRFDKYIEARVKKGISANVILSVDVPDSWISNVLENAKKYLLDFRMVSSISYPIEASIAVAGDWLFVAVATGKPFALLIQNRPLAQSVESFHDIIWGRYSR